MPLAFGTHFLVIPLGFWYAFAVSVYGYHHRCFGPRIDVLGGLRALACARAIIQIRHAHIQAQAGIASKTLDRADFPASSALQIRPKPGIESTILATADSWATVSIFASNALI
jgi:hypothetical protein